MACWWAAFRSIDQEVKSVKILLLFHRESRVFDPPLEINRSINLPSIILSRQKFYLSRHLSAE